MSKEKDSKRSRGRPFVDGTSPLHQPAQKTIKLQLSLLECHRAWLQREAEALGISMSAFLRRLIDDHMVPPT